MNILGFESGTTTVLATTTGQLTVYVDGDVNQSTSHPSSRELAVAFNKAVRRHQPDHVKCVANLLPGSPLSELDDWQRRSGTNVPPTVALNMLKSGQSPDAPDAAEAPIHPAPRPITQRDEPLPSLDESFVRPNGDVYLSRSLGAHSDVAVLRACRAAAPHWIGVLLEGPPGSGKTALAEVAHPDLLTIQGHGDKTVAQIVGSLQPTPSGGWGFVAGPLTVAMMEGRALLVDEINKMPEEVLAIFHAASDGRGQIILDDRPEDPVVVAQPGFCMIATLNPDEGGFTGLPDAIQSRFSLRIRINSDLDAARTLGVDESFLTLADNLLTYNRQNPELEDVWVPQMRELLATKTMLSSGLGMDFTARALLGMCPVPDDVPLLAERMALILGIDDLDLLELGAHV